MVPPHTPTPDDGLMCRWVWTKTHQVRNVGATLGPQKFAVLDCSSWILSFLKGYFYPGNTFDLPGLDFFYFSNSVFPYFEVTRARLTNKQTKHMLRARPD